MGRETLPPSPSAPRDNETAEREPLKKTPLDRAIELALSRESLHALGEENLRKAFVADFQENADGSASGKLTFRRNKNHEKWIGLKHIIPAKYASVTVTTPSGETTEGTRGPNGSFYDAEGKYVAVWEGYTFKAKPPAQTPPPPPERANESPSALAEVPISETVFVGDSLTVGMQSALRGANFVAKGGCQTGWMLTHFREFLRERAAGKFSSVRRVVIFGGVNDIASQKTPQAIQKNLDAMYREAKTAGLEVVACTIPQWNTEAFITRYERKGKKYPISAEELQARTRAVNQWILNRHGLADGPSQIADLGKEADFTRYRRVKDGLHFTGKASSALAKFIAAEGNINLPHAA
ncbi:hypothetical protein HYW83_05555 [Candidatus Peregrinibacteria bacterium]|nr:hypothetical protein [Candidatus Peregrinibacteria bacterium]